MPTLTFTAPIHAGQAEAWRRFTQELLGSQRPAHEASRRRLRVWHESVWLGEARAGELAIVQLEADDPHTLLARQAASELPFDRWFGDRWLGLTGCELGRAARAGRLEHIFEWNAAERSAAEQNDRPTSGVEQKETIK